MLSGKIAIVTGASSGIGEATALALAKAGAKVAIGARRVDRLQSVKSKIEEIGGEVFMQKLDVTKKTDCDSFVEGVLAKWGTIDILVNNAGLMPLSFFKNLKVSEWEQMIDVNIKGVLYCTGAVIPYLVAKKSGHIVNLSSVAGRIVFPAGSVYCATKHAVAAFSEGLRQEFSVRYNIRVTSIEPGVVATELNDTITDQSLQGFIENTKKMVALQADDIANAILFAVESPTHMNVNEILIRPTTQER
ncbi:MAG TPA: SDR family oxidoreductase [Candidatus Nitrosotenuis sp.]|jgi:NADP-dependent 3-hydroxy acid dehydrogenase YdfG|nr:SDR family oxidoreductase [Candidatus Nitrosotenuis sp.]HIH46034.1 SDR family oxidoreductase [Candidatus Nitrosotenuis sp.]HIH68174.1 SDR family oxidoreductase [Candidatus Nitrosotenuis sp.]HII04230.1 SDR family oxidoreductase [Candidatus Nitrosotenuis sp.]